MRIKYFPYQPHCFAFGGFDMQMLNALHAVKSVGVEASELDIWSRDNNFDIIHLWAVGPHNYHVINWSKKAGKKIIATVLIPYYDTARLKISYIKNYLSSSQKDNITYLNQVDKVVVVNDYQAEALMKYYKVCPSKIEIIPNIVENKYFELTNTDKNLSVLNDYILCTGNVSERKNQLNLAKACIKINEKLLLIGGVLNGEQEYEKRLNELIANNCQNIKWIKELPKGSSKLVEAYRNCSLFALPSHNETQPISALEAVAMRKPVLLLDRQYAHQRYYKGAVLAKSASVRDIERSLLEIRTKSIKPRYGNEINECREKEVGEAYKRAYKSIFD